MTPAYRKGQAAARRCHRLFDRSRIIVAAVNPYKRKEAAAQWAKGFNAAYGESA